MEIKQILTWILGAVAAYLLWGHIKWLSIVAIILAISYSVHPDEQSEHNATGMYPKPTANRLMWTFVTVITIFLYSLFFSK